MKDFIKKLIPPIILEWKNRPKQKYGYFGDYKEWKEVEKISSGYGSDIIIEKVRKSALKVKNGEAVYERDSIVFDKIEMSWPLLAGLLWIAGQNNFELEVIDFGGSLGTTYYQNRNFLKHTKRLAWHIVEQDKFAEIGKKEFADSILSFSKNDELEKLAQHTKPHVMIISSSLQFLQNPSEFLQRIRGLDIPYIIFDKIPFHVQNQTSDRLMLQKVPPKIYDASYPVWIFGYESFISKMKERYDLVTAFDAYPGYVENIENGQMHYKGFIFKKKI